MTKAPDYRPTKLANRARVFIAQNFSSSLFLFQIEPTSWVGNKVVCLIHLPRWDRLTRSFRIQHHALILLAPDHLERVQKVLPAGLDGRRVLLARARQVGVDQLDQAVEVLGRDLIAHVSVHSATFHWRGWL
jgi:hypothetical protein